MQRKIFISLLTLILASFFFSCESMEESEEAKAKRLARRKEYVERKQKAQVTTLSGLNATEMDALEQAREANKIDDASDFVYSKEPKAVKHPYLNDLNENDKSHLRDYRKSSIESQKARKEWIYGN